MLGEIRGSTWSPESKRRREALWKHRCPGECPGVHTARRSQPLRSTTSSCSISRSGGAMRTKDRICMEEPARSGASSLGTPETSSRSVMEATIWSAST